MTAKSPFEGHRVLLVEDEPLIGMLIADMLSSLGFAVLGPAARLEEALELAHGQEIDVAVLDLNLCGQTSLPVADALRARGVPFMFSTGYAHLIDTHDAPIVQKPFEQSDLAVALSSCLKNRH